MRILIVDDEPLARDRVRALLSRLPDIEIVAECEDGPSAVAAIETADPDVVLLDVQMPGMSGFEVVSAVGPERMPLVVFATAYDEFALRAFEAHAIDYLVKPFAPDRLRVAMERVATQLRGRDHRSLEASLRALVGTAQPVEHMDRFMVKRGHRFVFVRADEVQWIEAADNYAKLHTAKTTDLVRATLNMLESRLDPKRFVRVHRSSIVNTDHLQSMEVWGNGEYRMTLANGTRITSSRTYRTRLRHALGAFTDPG